MAWARIDDGFPDHPKAERLSDRAFRLHVTGLCYCNRNLTDGALNARAVRTLSASMKATKRHVAELVSAGLWDATEGGWQVHDFLDVNKSAADVKRLRDEAKERMRRSREHSDEHDDERSQNVLDGIGVSTNSKEIASADVRAVYDHWREKRGKSRANYNMISEGRRRRIKARLAEFTAVELCAAIDGIANDPWPDRPLHDDITVVFRSREQVEKFLEMAEAKPQLNGKLTAAEKARGWVKTVGWQYPDHDLWEELGKFGLEGEEKQRMAALALELQTANV